MTYVPYLVAGYGITFGTLAAYAGWMMRRRRILSAELQGRLQAKGVSS